MGRYTRLLRPTAILRRNAIYRGLLGGSRGWLAIGAVLLGGRALKRAAGSVPEDLGTERLEPGQTVCIDALAPLSRREKAALRRAR